MSMTQEQFDAWWEVQVVNARARGDDFFLEIPDHWYHQPRWGCRNGHVSFRYLKCDEDGDLCLECGAPVGLISPEFDDDRQLQAALDDFYPRRTAPEDTK